MKKIAAILLLAAGVAAAAPAAYCAGNQKAKKISVVAHRGFWNCDEAGYAKNSVASLVQAQKNGFWGSEFDVNMTADEQLLVFHDSSVEGKSIEKNPASAFDYFRLKNGEKIPTLDEYLTQGEKSKKTMLVLELKKHSCKEVEDRAVELVIEKLREHKLLKKNRVMFISFSMNICKEFARLAPGFTVQYLDTDYTADQVFAEGVNGIDTEHRALLKDGERFNQARSHGMSINVWTVNKPEYMEQIIDLGVDQITTDHPLVVRKMLSDKGITENK